MEWSVWVFLWTMEDGVEWMMDKLMMAAKQQSCFSVQERMTMRRMTTTAQTAPIMIILLSSPLIQIVHECFNPTDNPIMRASKPTKISTTTIIITTFLRALVWCLTAFLVCSLATIMWSTDLDTFRSMLSTMSPSNKPFPQRAWFK